MPQAVIDDIRKGLETTNTSHEQIRQKQAARRKEAFGHTRERLRRIEEHNIELERRAIYLDSVRRDKERYFARVVADRKLSHERKKFRSLKAADLKLRDADREYPSRVYTKVDQDQWNLPELRGWFSKNAPPETARPGWIEPHKTQYMTKPAQRPHTSKPFVRTFDGFLSTGCKLRPYTGDPLRHNDHVEKDRARAREILAGEPQVMAGPPYGLYENTGEAPKTTRQRHQELQENGFRYAENKAISTARARKMVRGNIKQIGQTFYDD